MFEALFEKCRRSGIDHGAGRAVREQDNHVIGGRVAVDGETVERAFDNTPEYLVHEWQRHLCVCCDHGEHSGHLRVDHSGAFNHAAYAKGPSPALSIDGGGLRAGIRGHDRPHGVIAPITAQ